MQYNCLFLISYAGYCTVVNNPICFLRSIWYSLTKLALVSGHAYITEEGTPDNIHVLKCKVCGNYSVSWSHGSLKQQK